MTPRILAVAIVTLTAALGAHLAAVLVFAAAVIITAAHLLPLLTVLTITGTVLVLAARIITVILRTGPGIVPCRKVVFAW